MKHRSTRILAFPWRWLAAVLGAAALALAGPQVRAGGTVSTNSTAALLQAMLGGGTVQLNLPDVLTLDVPIIVASDTVLENGATVGRTASISGGGRYRIFQVLPGVRFEIRGVTLRDGLSTNRGGAILNQGTLIASNVVFTANKATGSTGSNGTDGTVEFGFGSEGGNGNPGLPASGGAVHNEGIAVLEACTFSVNEANGGDGGDGGKGGNGVSRVGRGGDGGLGASAYGGAVANAGRLEILRSIFSGNAARGGAGGDGGSNGSTPGAGQGAAGAAAAGGAVHSSGWLRVLESAFTTNLVRGGAAAAAGAPEFVNGRDGAGGGPAWGGAIATWSTGIVVNSTFYTNLMAGGAGGAGAAGTFTVGDGGGGGDALGSGIHARGSLALTNVTLAWNAGTAGTGGAAASGGGSAAGDAGRLAGSGIAADAGTVATLVNTIVASSGFGTVHGPVVDAGHNLFTDSGTGAKVAGSIYGTDPLLGAYQVWIVGTPGCLPLSGSPVVDKARADATPAIDQRGFPRPGGVGPDIGALEVGALTYFISGEVRGGGKGLAGIPVYSGTNVVVTDAQGAFRFGPFPVGFYNIHLGTNAALYNPALFQVPVTADVTGLIFRRREPTLELTYHAVGGADTVIVSGVPDATCHLEGSVDLSNWSRLQTARTDTLGRVVFVQFPPADTTTWFYRVVAE